MNTFDDKIYQAIRTEPDPVPSAVDLRIRETLRHLPEDGIILEAKTDLENQTASCSSGKKHHHARKIASLAAGILLFFLVVLPNISVSYAQALEKIPVVGDLVQVLCIRTYTRDENQHHLEAQVPSVNDAQNPQASELINKNVNELTSLVIQKFYQEVDFSQGNGVGSFHINYEVLENSPEWFTLKLNVDEARGSTDSYVRYYHIDRTKGIYVQFSDLIEKKNFPNLRKMILDQMEEQMQADPSLVFLRDSNQSEESFAQLDEDQSFYFTSSGDMVIVYDRYEVAPGYMGCPEFTLSHDQIEPYLHDTQK